MPAARVLPWLLRWPPSAHGRDAAAHMVGREAAGRTADKIMLDVKPRSRIDTAFEPRSARSRGDGRPTVSLVCVASGDAPAMFRDLAERAPRWHRLGVELIIVSAVRHSAATTSLLGGSGARIIYGPAQSTDRHLRSLGLAAAGGDVVMLLDDPGTADEGWIERLSTSGRGANGNADA